MEQVKREKKCIDLVQGEFEDRLEDMKITDPDDENYIEGLCFDYAGSSVGEDRGMNSAFSSILIKVCIALNTGI